MFFYDPILKWARIYVRVGHPGTGNEHHHGQLNLVFGWILDPMAEMFSTRFIFELGSEPVCYLDMQHSGDTLLGSGLKMQATWVCLGGRRNGRRRRRGCTQGIEEKREGFGIKKIKMASEGLLSLAQNESTAAIIELNCETDFVARNEIFQYLVPEAIPIALEQYEPSEDLLTSNPTASSHHTR
ncbi:hypothetical protein ACLB2K_045546 [Fragaria x ananassa]